MEGIKDKEEEGKKAGVVYEIKCNTCNKSYIGETGRNAEIRAKNIEPTPGMDTLSNRQWHNMRWRAIS